MDQLLKTVKDYTNWKNNLKNVLDKNIHEVVNILVDAGAENNFIPIESANSIFAQPNWPQHSFQNQAPALIAKKGIVINCVPGTTTKLIWYFNGSHFYLINHGASTALNLQPMFGLPPEGFAPIYSQGVHSARFETQVEFLLAFIEWLPTLEEMLKNRMQSIDPKQAEAKINAFSKAVS